MSGRPRRPEPPPPRARPRGEPDGIAGPSAVRRRDRGPPGRCGGGPAYAALPTRGWSTSATTACPRRAPQGRPGRPAGTPPSRADQPAWTTTMTWGSCGRASTRGPRRRARRRRVSSRRRRAFAPLGRRVAHRRPRAGHWECRAACPPPRRAANRRADVHRAGDLAVDLALCFAERPAGAAPAQSDDLGGDRHRGLLRRAAPMSRPIGERQRASSSSADAVLPQPREPVVVGPPRSHRPDVAAGSSVRPRAAARRTSGRG